MRSDSEIKQDVEWELKWDREIDATHIAVAVKDGVVTCRYRHASGRRVPRLFLV
ncbi:BON domain-containing protein [Nitrosospira sp. Is2]|uniref:BON domain-containing protein n=1 Tax=Nitrosospira sp. Is2 TaxID=3080532 RepID=UPI0029537EF3|nr:BON domain-containing protein [Nitrosospira sp. Is2]WON73824.1 BON domain-containing protein [Nitrosospira sp. Is2]